MGKNSDNMIAKYKEKVLCEMSRRGYSSEEIPVIINKTGFYEALEKYPNEQMHFSINDTVDEILFVAAPRWTNNFTALKPYTLVN